MYFQNGKPDSTGKLWLQMSFSCLSGEPGSPGGSGQEEDDSGGESEVGDGEDLGDEPFSSARPPTEGSPNNRSPGVLGQVQGETDTPGPIPRGYPQEGVDTHTIPSSRELVSDSDPLLQRRGAAGPPGNGHDAGQHERFGQTATAGYFGSPSDLRDKRINTDHEESRDRSQIDPYELSSENGDILRGNLKQMREYPRFHDSESLGYQTSHHEQPRKRLSHVQDSERQDRDLEFQMNNGASPERGPSRSSSDTRDDEEILSPESRHSKSPHRDTGSEPLEPIRHLDADGHKPTVQNSNDHREEKPVCLKRKLFTIDSIIGMDRDQRPESSHTYPGDSREQKTTPGKERRSEGETKKERDVFDQIPSPPPKITDIEKLKAREFSYVSYPYACAPTSYAYLNGGRQIALGHLSPAAYAASLAAVREGAAHPGLVPLAGGGPCTPGTAATTPGACYQFPLSPAAPPGPGPHPYALSPAAHYMTPGQLSALQHGVPLSAVRGPLELNHSPSPVVKIESTDLQTK